MEVNERRTVVGGLIGHCVSPNRGERSTRMDMWGKERRTALLIYICDDGAIYITFY